jgi:hypothetical protein
VEIVQDCTLGVPVAHAHTEDISLWSGGFGKGGSGKQVSSMFIASYVVVLWINHLIPSSIGVVMLLTMSFIDEGCVLFPLAGGVQLVQYDPDPEEPSTGTINMSADLPTRVRVAITRPFPCAAEVI